jgi:hypothetical protein
MPATMRPESPKIERAIVAIGTIGRPVLKASTSPLGRDYRYLAGRIIARHICATGLLSKPSPCSG